MVTRTGSILVMLAAIVADGLLAQPAPTDTLFVGDPRVDGSVIDAFRVVWRATPWDSAGNPRASNRVEETVDVVQDENSVDVLRFTQTWLDSLGTVVFVTVRVAERQSMAYRAFHTGRAPDGLGRLDIRGPRVHGFYAPSPEQSIQEFALTLERTPFASFAGLLFAALPHTAGAAGVLPGFGWGGTTNPNLVWQRYRVVDRERVEVPGTSGIDAWRVETSRGPGSLTVYWVAKQPPYFLEAESRAANGSGIRFEIESWEVLPSGTAMPE